MSSINNNSNNGLSPLHEYVLNNDMDNLRELLQLKGVLNLNVDILSTFIYNGISREGTPLHAAILCKNYEAAQLLLEYGADVNKQIKEDAQPFVHIHSPLHMAIFKRDLKMVELLLEHGADVNVKNSHYDTPLGNAIMCGRKMDIIKLLLQRDDIDINICNNFGGTVFHYSFMVRDPDLIRELLKDSNLDVNVKTNIGLTALHYLPAVFNCGDSENKEKNINDILDIIELFSSRFDINIQDVDKNTPLHYIARDLPVEIASHVIGRLESMFSSSLNKDLKNKELKTYNDIFAQKPSS